MICSLTVEICSLSGTASSPSLHFDLQRPLCTGLYRHIHADTHTHTRAYTHTHTQFPKIIIMAQLLKGRGIDLEVAGSGLVSCCLYIPSSFFTMCSYLACLSFHFVPLYCSYNYSYTISSYIHILTLMLFIF